MIFKYSRYTGTPLAIDEGVTTFERRVIPFFDKKKCKKHTVIQGETLDLLAHNYYNNPRLWWAILDANIQEVGDYFKCITPGTILYIPPIDDIMEVIKDE